MNLKIQYNATGLINIILRSIFILAGILSTTIAQAENGDSINLIPRWDAGKTYQYVHKATTQTETTYTGEIGIPDSKSAMNLFLTQGKRVTEGETACLLDIANEITRVRVEMDINGKKRSFDSQIKNQSGEDAWKSFKDIVGIQIPTQWDICNNKMIYPDPSFIEEQLKDCAPCQQLFHNLDEGDEFPPEKVTVGTSWRYPHETHSLEEEKAVAIQYTFSGWTNVNNKQYAKVIFSAEKYVDFLSKQMPQEIEGGIIDAAFNGYYLFDSEKGVVVHRFLKTKTATLQAMSSINGSAMIVIETTSETRLVDIIETTPNSH